MQYLILFLGGFLSMFCVVAQLLEPYKFSRALHIESGKNKVGFVDILLNRKARSKIQCADACVNSEDCLLFFYNKNTKMCQTHGIGMNVDSSTFVEDDGSRYYRLTTRQLVGESCIDSAHCMVNHSECATNGRCVCADGYTYHADERSCTRTYIDCLDALLDGKNVNGVYNVYFSNRSKAVYCDQDTDGGGWLVFQRRTDGTEDFYRNWTDYAHGFGDIENEFWMGNEFLAELTAQNNYTLRIDLESFENETRFAKYGTFSIGSAQTNFTLSVRSYTGTAGDSLTRHNGYQFTTKDQDNDNLSYSCAVRYHGAWWYKNCHDSNLNGFYHGGSHSSYADGINWRHWLGYYNSLKKTEMKCRPTRTD